ncbi:hypothetical protein EJ08DRAFT_667234 [Tothia fuscella]|uniref:Kinetochore protein Sos7 coiled-coil domain-containing protein n=1 Tax=Tothia fuscella TaxID=1048955 RepID=A0A9P4P1E8_9PEZI|nr:hypothetical protein EJ08DRAFT_667234 [Tothia fuscella]
MAQISEDALKALQDLEASKPLSIIRLSESISGSNESGQKRSSDVSADTAYGDTSPANLAVDLVHYKELFSKLRFSYIEQVTKERFLRAITSETPLFIEPRENARLESQLLEEKSSLKAQKEEVAKMVAELEIRGKELAARYEQIHLQKATLADLPEKIAELEMNIQNLREANPSPTKLRHPNLNLPLPATLSLLNERESEISTLDAQIRALQAAIPRKARELDRLESELQPLMNQKKTAVTQAKEARQRREDGGIGDLEQKGRFYRAADASLRQMLGVEI